MTSATVELRIVEIFNDFEIDITRRDEAEFGYPIPGREQQQPSIRVVTQDRSERSESFRAKVQPPLRREM
jgi:hypothetical protein